LAADEEDVLHIATAEDFLAFAENCRLDSYSFGLTVSLDADIDLRGTEFDGVPWFAGVFQGNGYMISGLDIDCAGSVRGLFRHLAEGAVLRDLHVMGTVTPGGSRSQAGGLAGENAGSILNCSFQGSVSGADTVGGIAGRNTVTGLIENCRVKGEVSGSHFVGGIAGENYGVIRSSVNSAPVNATAQQNSVDLADVTLESLTNSEAVNTTTDVGGIAGMHSGVIRGCENRGNVGYELMGYNIGGIAGTQRGYIVDSVNRGAVHGRKEVGGIVGQMEPVSLIEYSKDALQVLEEQLGGMSYLVNRAVNNVRSNAKPLSGQLGVLQGQASTAIEALSPLFSGGGMPDPDAIAAARNTLSGSLQAMSGTLGTMGATVETTMNALTQDLQAVSGQIGAMGATLGEAKEKLGGSITDVSDADTAEDLGGKVERCINHGSVSADLNVGGIAGAMAIENDFDLLTDVESEGEESMNIENKLRSVILASENHGSVSASKQYAGGIVGWQTLGLVKNCVNTGSLDCVSADYVGGIAGLSLGYIRHCSARCQLEGSSFVGGIAGSAARCTDCHSQILLEADEQLGAILGRQTAPNTMSGQEEEEEPVRGNYYLPVGADIGAVDSISYKGLGEPLSRERFLALADLPELFQRVTLYFVAENGSETTVSLAAGSDLASEDIPAVPAKAGHEGEWAGLEEADLRSILFDQRFEASYTAHLKTLESQLERRELAVMLLQGDFQSGASLVLERCSETLPLSEGEELLDARYVAIDGVGSAESLRFLLPEETDSDRVRVMVMTDGVWTEREHRIDKSYAVAPWGEGDEAVALILTPLELSPVPVFTAAALILLAVIGLIRKKKVKKEVSP
ncbi:MAG: hypothetical protein IJE26_06685, partial [Oscillospiraceae bacterium]|nr:hypothetical protein [Oscillospiraceae bacterium]